MVAVNGHSIQSANSAGLLPAATNVIGYGDSQDRATFAMVTKMKEEPMDVESLDTNKDEVGGTKMTQEWTNECLQQAWHIIHAVTIAYWLAYRWVSNGVMSFLH